MTMPGFTAELSHIKSGTPYRVIAARMKGTEVIYPQLFGSTRLGRYSSDEVFGDLDSLSFWELLEAPRITPRHMARLGSSGRGLFG